MYHVSVRPVTMGESQIDHFDADHWERILDWLEEGGYSGPDHRVVLTFDAPEVPADVRMRCDEFLMECPGNISLRDAADALVSHLDISPVVAMAYCRGTGNWRSDV